LPDHFNDIHLFLGFLVDPTEYSFVQGIKVIKTSGWLIDKTDYLKKNYVFTGKYIF